MVMMLCQPITITTLANSRQSAFHSYSCIQIQRPPEEKNERALKLFVSLAHQGVAKRIMIRQRACLRAQCLHLRVHKTRPTPHVFELECGGRFFFLRAPQRFIKSDNCSFDNDDFILYQQKRMLDLVILFLRCMKMLLMDTLIMFNDGLGCVCIFSGLSRLIYWINKFCFTHNEMEMIHSIDPKSTSILKN